jgi:hypothetical protein
LGAENFLGRLESEAATVEEASPRRFGHYEIATRPDGSLQELGHGAMGITFKAIDVNLRIPVTLKVLNMRFFREEWARKRFFREARVAATVRHPNVASVYHLGMRGREMGNLVPSGFRKVEHLCAARERSGPDGVQGNDQGRGSFLAPRADRTQPG